MEEKKQGYSRIVAGYKAVFIAMLAFTAFMLIYFSAKDRAGWKPEEEIIFIDRWTVTEADGTSIETGREYYASKDYKEEFTISSTLPEGLGNNQYLCFSTGRNLSVYINGEFRGDFIEDRDILIRGGNVKRFYMMIPLEPSDSGAEVSIIRHPTFHSGQIVPETFVATMGGAYAFMLDHYGLTFMLSAIVAIFAIVAVIVGIAMRIIYRRSIGMLYGALAILDVAAWVITNSMLYPFIFGHQHVDGVANYMLCLMIPFGFLLYLDSVQHGRYRRSMTLLMIVSAVNAIFWSVLHFTGVFSFHDALVYINVILGILALFAIAILFIDAKAGHTSGYRYTAVGFTGFLACGVFEIIYMLFLSPKYEELPMVVGMSFFLIFVIVQQMDEIRRVNVEKQHAMDLSESKTRFLASMSHEIRTPINSILGMNEMILRENRDPVVGEYARNIKNSGRMLLMLVNDVLDFSRIEAGKLEIMNAEYSLSKLLSDVMSMTGERAAEKDIKLTIMVGDDIPDGEISDEFRIRQVLINLLGNAIKYTDRGMVSLNVEGEYSREDRFILTMTVKDTGRGIRQEDQEHLFEAFSRGDLNRNVSIEGTGLGLSIVKSILDSMDGTISVESIYGVGSAFRVRIPVGVFDRTAVRSDFETADSDGGYGEEPVEITAPSAEVLAVDDNRSNLTIVKLFLKRTMIRPDLCESGEKAIRMCRKKKYDLILLDHMMPHPDGIETLETIRTDPDSLNKDTAAVVLTANALAGSRQLYMEAGFADYLTKPLDSKLLESTILRLLPEEKLVRGEEKARENSSFSMEFIPDAWGTKEEREEVDSVKLREDLLKIEGLDYDTAIMHCGGEASILSAIIGDIATECVERCDRMRKSMDNGDINAYRIDAHAIKSLMAMIGLSDLSERARKHEAAAKENDIAFLKDDAENLVSEYEAVCEKLRTIR
ncbi:MAG: response regulator [Lachnospiraceae bacterium]|nr:response regulator [Lachnospiraceae bacterium]